MDAQNPHDGPYLPEPDLGRLSALTIDDLFVAVMATRGAQSARQLNGATERFAPDADAESTLDTMADTGLVESAGQRWRLSARGLRHRLAASIRATKSSWGRVRARILPAAALGVPLEPGLLDRLARSDHLRAMTLTVLYDLPLPIDTVRLPEARSCLVARSLSAHYAGLRLPPIRGTERLDPFSTAILRGMAGTQSGGVMKALQQLAGRALGTPDHSIEGLRRALVAAALSLGGKGRHAEVELDEFAGRVQSLADAEATPPFEDRLAISAAYELYLQRYGDVGSLTAFKARLMDAHRGRWLSLRRLDYLDAVTSELREESEVEIDGRAFHFVARVS